MPVYKQWTSIWIRFWQLQSHPECDVWRGHRCKFQKTDFVYGKYMKNVDGFADLGNLRENNVILSHQSHVIPSVRAINAFFSNLSNYSGTHKAITFCSLLRTSFTAATDCTEDTNAITPNQTLRTALFHRKQHYMIITLYFHFIFKMRRLLAESCGIRHCGCTMKCDSLMRGWMFSLKQQDWCLH